MTHYQRLFLALIFVTHSSFHAQTESAVSLPISTDPKIEITPVSSAQPAQAQDQSSIDDQQRELFTRAWWKGRASMAAVTIAQDYVALSTGAFNRFFALHQLGNPGPRADVQRAYDEHQDANREQMRLYRENKREHDHLLPQMRALAPAQRAQLPMSLEQLEKDAKDTRERIEAYEKEEATLKERLERADTLEKGVEHEKSATFKNNHINYLLYALFQELVTDIAYIKTRQALDTHVGTGVAPMFEESILAVYQSMLGRIVLNRALLSPEHVASFVATDITYEGLKQLIEQQTGKKLACPSLPIPALARYIVTEKSIDAGARWLAKNLIKHQFDRALGVTYGPLVPMVSMIA